MRRPAFSPAAAGMGRAECLQELLPDIKDLLAVWNNPADGVSSRFAVAFLTHAAKHTY